MTMTKVTAIRQYYTGKFHYYYLFFFLAASNLTLTSSSANLLGIMSRLMVL